MTDGLGGDGNLLQTEEGGTLARERTVRLHPLRFTLLAALMFVVWAGQPEPSSRESEILVRWVFVLSMAIMVVGGLTTKPRGPSNAVIPGPDERDPKTLEALPPQPPSGHQS